jgi:hypothetical protein
MNQAQLEEAVKEVMGKDPIEMCINYYKSLIQISADRIAEEQKQIGKLEKRIAELAQPQKREEE